MKSTIETTPHPDLLESCGDRGNIQCPDERDASGVGLKAETIPLRTG